MVSGCSLFAYWMGNYISDIIFQTVPAIVAVFGIWAFGLTVPYAWVLFIIVIFANPAFIYAFSFLFEKDDAGSLSVKMIYFLLGIIAPIAISILQVVNETTINIANVLRWFFYPFPVYSLSFGYISISNRDIIKFVKKLSSDPDVFSTDVAGLSLIFLLSFIPFYWILVIMFETKVFDILCCKRGNRNENQG